MQFDNNYFKCIMYLLLIILNYIAKVEGGAHFVYLWSVTFILKSLSWWSRLFFNVFTLWCCFGSYLTSSDGMYLQINKFLRVPKTNPVATSTTFNANSWTESLRGKGDLLFTITFFLKHIFFSIPSSF